MVEYVAVEVVSGPDIQAPRLAMSTGTLTALVPMACHGTVIAGSLASAMLSDGALAQVVSGRLLPAWANIQSLALQARDGAAR